MFLKFEMSARYKEYYPGVNFGLTLISGCRDRLDPPDFVVYKRKLLRKMRKRETLAQITERIETYAAFFGKFGMTYDEVINDALDQLDDAIDKSIKETKDAVDKEEDEEEEEDEDEDEEEDD